MPSLKEMLDLVYEIEGLTELAMRRDPVPAPILPLIAEKTATLATLASELAPQHPLASTIPEPVVPAENPVEIEEEGYEAGNVDEDIYVTMEGEQDVTPLASGPEIYEVSKSPEALSVPQVEAQAPAVNNGNDDIKRYFSINDKFRFRRELFGNDADQFARALELITRMKSYEDAEEYFYNDMQWDPENEDVMAYMSKVQDYFER